MAQLEHEHDVRSTYYILPHNDFYAPFAPEGRRALLRMIELGHEVGLHCDAALYPEEPAAYRRAVQRDIEALEEITGHKVVSASQHRPNSRSFELGDMIEIEAYEPRVREKFTYVSDSAMSWRSATPWDLLSSRKNLQLLIHPVWWMAPGTARKEKFEYLKKDETELQGAKLDAELAYIEQCLIDREQLDARLARQWSELHGDDAVKVSGAQK